MITVELVARKLLAYPKLIGALEQLVFEQEEVLRERRNQYKEMEAGSLLQENGPINGKNEQIRQAQLWERLAPERIMVEAAEREVAQTKLQLNVEKNGYRSWLAIQALMSALQLSTIEVDTDVS